MLRIWPFYRASTRDIFQYHDGVRRRYGDPLVLYRGLASHAAINLAEDMARLLDGGDAGVEAHQRIVSAVRDVFGVPAYGDRQPGLTERETIDLFWEFADFIEVLKKNSSPLPTSPPATEPPPSPPLESTSDTPDSSDSTST